MFRGQLPFKPVFAASPWKSPEQNETIRATLAIDEQGPVYYATGPGYPGGGNTYVPPDISDRLRIGFSRNAKKFHLPKYVQYVESPKHVAYYLKITSADATRILNTNDFAWPDGQVATDPDTGTESFNFIPFVCKRNKYDFKIGDITSEQAAWPIVEQHASNMGSKLMTARTIRMFAVATNTANWTIAGSDDNAANLAYDHTASASALGFGPWDQGTATTPNIQNTCGYVADIINQDTQGVIDSEPEDSCLIMNPRTARLVAASPEIKESVKYGPYSQPQIMKGFPGNRYGLPAELYSYKVIVENATRNIAPKNLPPVRVYCVPNQAILFTSRVGGLEGAYGAPSFSTLTMFWWKHEMTVQVQHDNWSELNRGRCVEMTSEQITCSASGFLLTSATSV
jgi:hypothetical protein